MSLVQYVKAAALMRQLACAAVICRLAASPTHHVTNACHLRSHGMDIVGPDVEGTPHADLAFQPAAQYEPLMDAVYEVRAVHELLPALRPYGT